MPTCLTSSPRRGENLMSSRSCMLTNCTPLVMSSGRRSSGRSRSSSGRAVELTRSLFASFWAARASCSCFSCFAAALSVLEALSALAFSFNSSSESSLNLSRTLDIFSALMIAFLMSVSSRWPLSISSSGSIQQTGRRCVRLCLDWPICASSPPPSQPLRASFTSTVRNGSRHMSSGMSTFILSTCRYSKLVARMFRAGPVLDSHCLSRSDLTRSSPPGTTRLYSNLMWSRWRYFLPSSPSSISSAFVRTTSGFSKELTLTSTTGLTGGPPMTPLSG
mmetsp:Transcript_77708/g.204037  ORF Transcript_77708/g.204037 Transcript_77708/m.204037 type:complete len:277 (+) Transcript_77708:1625-2455(+)